MGYGAIASAAGNVIGGQLQGWASLMDKWVMQDAYAEELHRQGRYQRQASDVFNTQLAGAGSAGAAPQMAAAYGDRLGNYQSIGATPLGVTPPYQRGAGARDAATVNMMGSDRANLNKYADWLFNQKLQNLKTGRKLDEITNFASGTSRVFPYRMYDAQHACDVLSEI